MRKSLQSNTVYVLSVDSKKLQKYAEKPFRSLSITVMVLKKYADCCAVPVIKPLGV